MAKLTGVGAPTRKTQGAIGDIYVDTNTKQEYICTFAYKSGNDEELECDWKKKPTSKKVQISTAYGEFKKEEKKPEIPVENVVADEVKETIEEPVTPNRKDYSAYSKKNK